MGKRADVVLLLEGVVFVVEFKVGSKSFDGASLRQVHDINVMIGKKRRRKLWRLGQLRL